MDINKNIKKMRNEKNLTQEELAQKINVTRQAVSNWENAKTQPDLETLTAIAEALEIDFEMLLYGKKYVKDDGSAENTKKLSGIKIVLSVVGTVFIAVGLVIIFFNFWEDFPEILKVILSAVPLLFSQGFAVYVLKKKYGHTSWRECAGTAIVIGAVSTVALINSVLDIHCGTENCLVIDALMCIPAIFLFNAVMPLAACLGMAVFMTVYGYFVPAALVILIGFAFTVYNKKKIYDTRFSVTAFLNVLAVELFALVPFLFGLDVAARKAAFAIVPIAFIFPFALDLITFKTDSVFQTPVKIFNLFGSLFVLCFMDIIGSSIVEDMVYYGHTNNYMLFAVPFVIILCAYIALFVIKHRDWQETGKLTLISGVSVAVWMISCLLYCLPKFPELFLNWWTASYIRDLLFTVLRISASVFAVCKIADGVKNISFLKVNAGLIAAFINMMIWILTHEPDVFVIGITLLIFGAVLITVNALMAHRVKQDKNTDASEVTENAEE